MHIGNDNIRAIIFNIVSPENGHLWVAHFVNVFQFFKCLYNHSEPMPGKIMHIAIDQNADLLLTDYKLEEVLSYSGESINAVTTGLYQENYLLEPSERTCGCVMYPISRSYTSNNFICC